MTRLTQILLIGLLTLAGQALAAEEPWPLKQVFGAGNVALIQTGRNAVVEYCPGDTCTRFMLEGDKSLPILHDFAFLYLALVQNYDIEQAKAPNGERHFTAVLNRRKGPCSGADENAVARCTLASMASRHPVQGYVSKMHEGWRRSEPFDLRAEMARAGIR